MANQQTTLMDPAEAQLRRKLYTKLRLQYQIDWYSSRIDEYQDNATAMLWISALIMAGTGLVSFAATSGDQPLLAMFTALLPALATAITSFQAVYQWERQATIYEDTELALESIKLNLPPEVPADRELPVLRDLITRAEDAFRTEASQWGQLEGQLPLRADGTIGEEDEGDSR